MANDPNIKFDIKGMSNNLDALNKAVKDLSGTFNSLFQSIGQSLNTVTPQLQQFGSAVTGLSGSQGSNEADFIASGISARSQDIYTEMVKKDLEESSLLKKFNEAKQGAKDSQVSMEGDFYRVFGGSQGGTQVIASIPKETYERRSAIEAGTQESHVERLQRLRKENPKTETARQIAGSAFEKLSVSSDTSDMMDEKARVSEYLGREYQRIADAESADIRDGRYHVGGKASLTEAEYALMNKSMSGEGVAAAGDVLDDYISGQAQKNLDRRQYIQDNRMAGIGANMADVTKAMGFEASGAGGKQRDEVAEAIRALTDSSANRDSETAQAMKDTAQILQQLSDNVRNTGDEFSKAVDDFRDVSRLEVTDPRRIEAEKALQIAAAKKTAAEGQLGEATQGATRDFGLGGGGGGGGRFQRFMEDLPGRSMAAASMIDFGSGVATSALQAGQTLESSIYRGTLEREQYAAAQEQARFSTQMGMVDMSSSENMIKYFGDVLGIEDPFIGQGGYRNAMNVSLGMEQSRRRQQERQRTIGTISGISDMVGGGVMAAGGTAATVMTGGTASAIGGGVALGGVTKATGGLNTYVQSQFGSPISILDDSLETGLGAMAGGYFIGDQYQGMLSAAKQAQLEMSGAEIQVNAKAIQDAAAAKYKQEALALQEFIDLEEVEKYAVSLAGPDAMSQDSIIQYYENRAKKSGQMPFIEAERAYERQSKKYSDLARDVSFSENYKRNVDEKQKELATYSKNLAQWQQSAQRPDTFLEQTTEFFGLSDGRDEVVKKNIELNRIKMIEASAFLQDEGLKKAVEEADQRIADSGQDAAFLKLLRNMDVSGSGLTEDQISSAKSVINRQRVDLFKKSGENDLFTSRQEVGDFLRKEGLAGDKFDARYNVATDLIESAAYQALPATSDRGLRQLGFSSAGIQNFRSLLQGYGGQDTVAKAVMGFAGPQGGMTQGLQDLGSVLSGNIPTDAQRNTLGRLADDFTSKGLEVPKPIQSAMNRKAVEPTMFERLGVTPGEYMARDAEIKSALNTRSGAMTAEAMMLGNSGIGSFGQIMSNIAGVSTASGLLGKENFEELKNVMANAVQIGFDKSRMAQKFISTATSLAKASGVTDVSYISSELSALAQDFSVTGKANELSLEQAARGLSEFGQIGASPTLTYQRMMAAGAAGEGSVASQYYRATLDPLKMMGRMKQLETGRITDRDLKTEVDAEMSKLQNLGQSATRADAVSSIRARYESQMEAIDLNRQQLTEMVGNEGVVIDGKTFKDKSEIISRIKQLNESGRRSDARGVVSQYVNRIKELAPALGVSTDAMLTAASFDLRDTGFSQVPMQQTQDFLKKRAAAGTARAVNESRIGIRRQIDNLMTGVATDLNQVVTGDELVKYQNQLRGTPGVSLKEGATRKDVINALSVQMAHETQAETVYVANFGDLANSLEFLLRNKSLLEPPKKQEESLNSSTVVGGGG